METEVHPASNLWRSGLGKVCQALPVRTQAVPTEKKKVAWSSTAL